MAKAIYLAAQDGLRQLSKVEPVASSARSPWRGFLLEEHEVPSGESGATHFADPLICVHRCSPTVEFTWREAGRERTVTSQDGDVSFCSDAEYQWAHWSGPHRILALTISRSAIPELLAEWMPGRQPELKLETNFTEPVLRHLVIALAADLKGGHPTGHLFGESLANLIASYAFTHYAVANLRIPEFKDGLDPRRLARVVEYIECALHKELTIAELARVAAVSPFHFARLFKQSTGKTVHQFVLDRRIQLARELLGKSTMAIVEICSRIGFSNQSHFTTAFRTKTGMTPARFRTSTKRK